MDRESVRRAVLLVGYFKSHARKVYPQLRRGPDDRLAEAVFAWVQNHGNQCNARQLQRSNVAGITLITEANTAIKAMVDRGRGALIDRAAANGKKVAWFIAGDRQPGPAVINSFSPNWGG